MKKSTIFSIIGIAVFAVAIYVFMFIYKDSLKDASPASLSKSVTITVVDQNGEKTSYPANTSGSHLKDALDSSAITYEEKDGMLMVVNDIRADYVLDGAYWYIYLNDEPCAVGYKDQIIRDGDKFSIVYTKA